MKKLFVLSLLWIVGIIYASHMEAQNNNQLFNVDSTSTKKELKRHIKLYRMAEKSFGDYPPEIVLLQENYSLKASILNNKAPILVQIVDKNSFIVFEDTIDVSQQEWLLNTDFLASNTEYTIKFIYSQRGYLFGCFFM